MDRPSQPLYTPLKPGEFRLVNLHEGKGNDEVRCTLEVFTLYNASVTPPEADSGDRAPDPGPYEALSYTWGSPDNQLPIKIFTGNHTVHVYPNLYQALLGFRHQDVSRYLWIDALCIDQQNGKEKSSQVREMERIYNKARRVNIWLGVAQEGSTKAIEFIKNRLLKSPFDSLVKDKQLAADWEALYQLMRRPWFSRGWIIQEIALSKSATLFCGRDSIPWEDFSNAVSLLVYGQAKIREVFRRSIQFNNNPDYLGELSESPAAQLVKLWPSIFSKAKDGSVLAKLLSLEELICGVQAFETSNPRDILYAILSMARDVKPYFTDAGDTTGTIADTTTPAIYGVIPREWREVVGWTNVSDHGPPDPFWRTLVGDRYASGRRAGPLWKLACQIAFQYPPHGGDLFPKELLQANPEPYVHDYLRRVSRTVWSRRLAVLSEIPVDQSLCLVPRKARTGDKVCILYRCSVPVILRESRPGVDVATAQSPWLRTPVVGAQGQDVTYELVGESYVYGMMDGEALSYKRDRNIPDQRFRLI